MVSSFDDVYQQALDDAADQVRAPQGVRRMGVNFARDAGIMGGIAAPSEDDQEMRASLTRFTSRPNSLRGLFHQLTGNVDAAQEQYRRVDEINARADALDSNVDTDLRNARSVGDVAAGVRKLLIQSGPDMALGGLAGGLGRAGARRAAIGAEAKALARNPSQELAQAAAKARPGAAAATPEVAALQRQEALQKAARAAVRGDKDAMARVDRAGRVGGFTAGTAGMVPGLLAEQNEFLQEHTGQADAAKVLAAATGAAALEYLPLDRLMGRAFKNPALKQAFLESNPSLGRQLARRATTAGKRVAGQAAWEGGTEAAQALVQRAGHKWIDNNVELFSREALDDYVANAIAGAALGGVMGASVDVPQAVAGGTADTARWAWDRSGNVRESIRENLAKPWFRGQGGASRLAPGAPMGPGGAGGAAAGVTASDILARVQGTLRTAGGKVRSTAADSFQKAADALRTNEDLDAQADAVMSGLDAAVNADLDDAPAVGARPGMAKGQFLRNWALSKVAPEYLGQLGDGAAGHLGNALNHLARGATLTAPQKALVERAMAAGALSSADFDTVRAVGPTMLKRMNAMSRTAGDELGTLKSPQFGQQGNARAVIDEDGDEAVDTGVEEIVGLNEQRGDRELSALDRANSAREGMRAAQARGDEARAQEQRAEGVAAFNEAREKLLGGLTTEENRSSTKAAQHYDTRKSQPGFVELADKVDKSDGRGKVMRGQLVNLAMLIKRQQDAMRREGSVAEDIKPRDALLRGLSELAQAGAAINPDTLTKGDIVAEYKNKAGEKTRNDEHIMYLSAKDIAAIKGLLAKPTKKDVDLAPRSAEARDQRLDKDFASATRYENEANPEPITAADADRGVLRARDTPPGEDMGGGTFTPSNSPVSSVSFDTRYQKDLNEWRKQRRLAGDDQAKLVAINQHFGQKIGAEELARESEAGTINPARLESELARLKDPASGLAERYLERAARGKLPGGETTASVRHMPYDNEAPAKGEKNDSWETQVDDEGEYRGEDADLRKRADKNRRTAKTLVKKSHPQADEQHKKNKKRLTLSKAREGASPEVSTGDGLGQAKKQPAKPEPIAKPKSKVGQRRVVKKSEAANEDLDGALESSAKTQPGQHNLKRESLFIMSVGRALGYTAKQFPLHKVTNAVRNALSGKHNYATGEIGLGDALVGEERVEVLAHEIGHAIVAAEISKATGVPVEQLRDASGAYFTPDTIMDGLKGANPELYTALKSDYDAWRAKNGADTDYIQMRASRSGPFRTRNMAVRQQAAGRAGGTVGDVGNTGYDLSMNEWLADNIGRALLQSKPGSSIVEKFFADIAAKLKQAYEMLFGSEKGAKYAPAPSVKAWIDGLFDAQVAATKGATGQSVPKATADAAVTASVATAGSPPTPPTPPSGTAAPNLPPDEFNALREYVRVVLPAEAKQVLTRAFNTPAANKLFREFFPEVIEQINDVQDGMTARIAAGYMLWKAGVDIGGPKTQDTLGRWKAKLMELFNLASSSDYAQRIMYDMAKGRVAQMKADRAKYDFRAYEARSRGNLQKAVNAIGDVKDKIFDPINRMLESNTQRAFESGIPSMRKIAGALYKPQGYAGEDRGMVRDAVHRTALFADRAVKIMAPLSDLQRRRVMDLLQRQASEAELTRASKSDPNKPAHSAKVQQAVREVRKLMDESLKYMRDAGVKVGQIDNFYPVQLDIRDDAVALKLQRLLERPHLEDAIRNLDQFAKRDEDGNKTPSEEPIADLITNLVDGARRTQRPAKTGAGAPNFTGANQRLMSFIYEVGTPQDIKDFAALQTKNPAESFSRYFDPMVKRAEYARRFGDDGNKLNAMLEKMKEEGAAPEQVQQAKNMVEAALGTYGSELSPVLNMISPALAKRFSGDKTRATIDGLQAYQNARLLPLALLSSLVDPAGIMVRAGGDAGIAWRGFRDGLKTLYNKSSREQMEDMLRMLGASSDMATQEALNQLFGGAGSKFSQKVNEVVFKWNGMSAWVRATRYMALTAGHEFLLNHGGRRTNEHSARYLEELGLKAGDIQPQIVKQPDGSERVLVDLNTGDAARDARVRQALMDFVDGAVLRPNSQQSPQWHSDPYMGLITQYKSFAYAFYDQIAGRVGTEMRNGNAKVLAAAAAYFPVIIMAEMLRNVLQGDSDDTEDWGPDDWAMLGLERSGFVNPTLMAAKDTVGDVQHNRMPGTSQMGATPSQARNVLKAFDGQRDLGKEFESALPGSALWRKWNDGPRTAAGEA